MVPEVGREKYHPRSWTLNDLFMIFSCDSTWVRRSPMQGVSIGPGLILTPAEAFSHFRNRQQPAGESGPLKIGPAGLHS